MIGCLKGIASLGGFIILAIGLAATCLTIYLTVGETIPSGVAEEDKKNILLALFLIDAAILIGAVIGIIGISKGNNTCIFVFQILVLLFGMIFFVLLILSFKTPPLLFSGNCQSSPDNELIGRAFYVSIKSLLFCTSACRCGLTDQTIYGPTYTQDETQEILALTQRVDTGPTNFKDCPVASFGQNSTIIAVFDAFRAMEDLLECSLWCDAPINLFYRFSDVNKGKPKHACYDRLKDVVTRLGTVVGWTMVAFCIVMILVFLVNICICCHPERKGLPLRQRFIFHYVPHQNQGYQRM